MSKKTYENFQVHINDKLKITYFVKGLICLKQFFLKQFLLNQSGFAKMVLNTSSQFFSIGI